jgi:pimeloyl-ACP methyl ester carboxylesterase
VVRSESVDTCVAPTRLHRVRTGAGEPLLLIHGLGRHLLDWSPVLGALAARHDVIAVDLPGHGKSLPLPVGSSVGITPLVEAVASELDALGLDSVHVAGSSIGGWVALELARRGRAHTVVAISPGGLGTPRENRRTRRITLMLRRVAPVALPAAGPLVRTSAGRRLFCSTTAARPQMLSPSQARAETRAFVDSQGVEQMMDWFVAHRAEQIRDVTCPVTVVWGTKDQILPVRQAERFREQIPHAEIRILDGLGHVPMSDDPALVASTILEGTARRAGSATATRDQ